MKYVFPFIVKFIMITAVLWVVLGLFYNVSFGNILATSLLLSAISYAGDIFLMPKFGNTVASLADFVLIWAVVWLVGNNIFEGPIALGTAAFISAVALTLGEIFFHRYLIDHVLTDEHDQQSKVAHFPRERYQTEFSSEMEETDGHPPNEEK
ncbi:YndM family protein [Oceanobacillus massiliensis]|uniref:YndM family protein n=1 Tax=Oceanobacillus massiliensis TaxID=1465765 RepID=UPI0030158AB5